MLQEWLKEGPGGAGREASRFQKPPGSSQRLREAPAEQTTDFHVSALESIALFYIYINTVICLWFCRLFVKMCWSYSRFSSTVPTLLSVFESHFSKCRSFVGKTPQNQGKLTRTELVHYHIGVRTLIARSMFREIPCIVQAQALARAWCGSGSRGEFEGQSPSRNLGGGLPPRKFRERWGGRSPSHHAIRAKGGIYYRVSSHITSHYHISSYI